MYNRVIALSNIFGNVRTIYELHVWPLPPPPPPPLLTYQLLSCRARRRDVTGQSRPRRLVARGVGHPALACAVGLASVCV